MHTYFYLFLVFDPTKQKEVNLSLLVPPDVVKMIQHLFVRFPPDEALFRPGSKTGFAEYRID